MKKNGFTMIELLAAISIMAILAIVAVPRFLELYKNALKNTFNDELNIIIRTAGQKYVLNWGTPQTFSNSSNPLELTDNNIEYCISIDANGKVTTFKATNGKFQYTNSGIVSQTVPGDIVDATEGFTVSCS